MKICFILLGEGKSDSSRLRSQNWPLLSYQFSEKKAELQEMRPISFSGLCFPGGFKATF